MPRTLLALFALVLLVPPALASPIASVGVGERGRIVHDDSAPYYILVNVTEPDRPHEGHPSEDCSYEPGSTDKRPPPLEHALLILIARIASWRPTDEPRISGWYPECFAGTLGVPGSPVPVSNVSGRVSYDFSTGRYFVHVDPGLPRLWPDGDGDGDGDDGTKRAALPGPTFRVDTQVTLAGGSGVETVTDCETCPPPP